MLAVLMEDITFRQGKKLSQKDLGKLLGVSQQMIGQWESSAANLTFATIQKIADALKVSMSDIVNTTGSVMDPSVSAFMRMGENFREVITFFPNRTQTLSKLEQNVLSDDRKLNNEGRTEARKRIKELAEIPRYTESKKNLPDEEE